MLRPGVMCNRLTVQSFELVVQLGLLLVELVVSDHVGTLLAGDLGELEDPLLGPEIDKAKAKEKWKEKEKEKDQERDVDREGADGKEAKEGKEGKEGKESKEGKAILMEPSRCVCVGEGVWEKCGFG